MDRQLNTPNEHDPKQFEDNYFDRQFWRLWFLMVGVSVFTTGALAMTMRSLRGIIHRQWPWGGTEVVLLVGLFLMVALLASYLTYQQKRILALRSSLEQVRLKNAEASRRHRSRLVAFYSVSQVLADTNDPQMVFDRITGMCKHVFESERVSLMLLDARTQELVVQSAIGHPNLDEVIGSRKKLGCGISGIVARKKEAILLSDEVSAEEFPGHERNQDSISTSMIAPLIVRDEVAGILSVANHSSGMRYDAEDLAALKIFAEIAEYSIRHYEQAQWMRQTIESLRGKSKAESEPESAVS